MCIYLMSLLGQLILRVCVNKKNKTIATSGFIKAGISQVNVLINIKHGSETEVGNQSTSVFFFSLSPPQGGPFPACSTAAKALSIWHTFTEYTSTIITP